VADVEKHVPVEADRQAAEPTRYVPVDRVVDELWACGGPKMNGPGTGQSGAVHETYPGWSPDTVNQFGKLRIRCRAFHVTGER